MEIQEARDILEEIGLTDTITPDLVVATEVVLARVDELENVVSAYRKSGVTQTVAETPPEGYENDCPCGSCERLRSRNGLPSILPPPQVVPATTPAGDGYYDAQRAGWVTIEPTPDRPEPTPAPVYSPADGAPIQWTPNTDASAPWDWASLRTATSEAVRHPSILPETPEPMPAAPTIQREEEIPW